MPTPGRRFAQAYPAEARSVRRIRDQVALFAEECGLGESEIADVRLGVTEIVTNAIVHGYQRPEGPARSGEEIRVEVSLDSDALVVVIADDGLGVAPRLESPGLGLGLPVVASLTRSLELISPERGGTEVHMTFACPPGRA